MKGNDKVIEYLNEVLKAELTAINQYFLHAEMLSDWGYKKLAAAAKKESIDEMKHAELMIERILFLDGKPTMNELFPLHIGHDVKTQFENDLALELDAIDRLNHAIRVAMEANDNGSRELFEQLLTDEEGHADFLETQLHMMQEMGSGHYLGRQLDSEA